MDSQLVLKLLAKCSEAEKEQISSILQLHATESTSIEPLPDVNLEKLKCSELQQMCIAKNLSKSGKKAVLIARLKTNEQQNDNPLLMGSVSVEPKSTKRTASLKRTKSKPSESSVITFAKRRWIEAGQPLDSTSTSMYDSVTGYTFSPVLYLKDVVLHLPDIDQAGIDAHYETILTQNSTTGLYIEPKTQFVFDKFTEEAIGIFRNEQVFPLTLVDIEKCIQYGFSYKLPTNLTI